MIRVPLATYRLQLTKDFTFDDAARIAPYLKKLGISHVYASPFLKARAGSTHGYDIVDHNEFNPDLGGAEGFLRFSDALREVDLELILDFVPNHMGIGLSDNIWWLDVLEWGQKSPHAASFDIDWDALPHRHQPGVLLPILGKPYGEALESGELKLKYDRTRGEFAVWYFEHKLPVTPPRYGEVLRKIVDTAGAGKTNAGAALLALVLQFPGPNRPNYREGPTFKKRMTEISGAAEIIEQGLQAFNGNEEESRNALHRLLERQNYRVAFWRVAFSAINYRRFFDVNDLAGVRMEHPGTFVAAHSLIARLIADNRLHGIRLDHIDGLYDPMQYAQRLRQLARKAGAPEFYVLVEKIIEDDEAMPPFPGVAGTTGYEWLNVISRVLVDARGLQPLQRTWREFTGETRTLAEMLDEAKSRVLETMLASEFTVLTERLSRIAAGHFTSRDYTLDRLRAALKLYVLEFPVYRTYATAAGISDRDREIIADTITRARKRWSGPDPNIFEFIASCLDMSLARDPHYSASRIQRFAMKLQQFTGPLMAKSLEDTAFYRHHRLLALNEVGGSPEAGPLSPDAFHERMRERRVSQPHGLTATATHDTKRGEDARTRILSLSQIPQEWDEAVHRWRAMNAPLRSGAGMPPPPSAAHEYMLYQTLIGSWPTTPDDHYIERIQAYAVKAAREGKQETSWTNPDTGYENGLTAFVKNLLAPSNDEFLEDFASFAQRTSLLGALLSLSQLTLKIMQPGVPDFYQGTELWDFSLVDPDNRRSVDFTRREQLCASEFPDWKSLTRNWPSAEVKLALTRQLLDFRSRHANLFRKGTYQGVASPANSPVLAFTVSTRREQIVVVVAKDLAAATSNGSYWPDHWEGTLPFDVKVPLRNIFGRTYRAGETIELDGLLATLPVAVLEPI